MGFAAQIKGISSLEVQEWTLKPVQQGSHNGGTIKPAIVEAGERAALTGEIQHVVMQAPGDEAGFWTDERIASQRARARDLLNKAGLKVGSPDNLRAGTNEDRSELYIQFRIASKVTAKTNAADKLSPSAVKPVQRASVTATQPFAAPATV